MAAGRTVLSGGLLSDAAQLCFCSDWWLIDWKNCPDASLSWLDHPPKSWVVLLGKAPIHTVMPPLRRLCYFALTPCLLFLSLLLGATAKASSFSDPSLCHMAHVRAWRWWWVLPDISHPECSAFCPKCAILQTAHLFYGVMWQSPGRFVLRLWLVAFPRLVLGQKTNLCSFST